MNLATVYGVLIFIFVVIFLINSIRLRKAIKVYLKYGVVFAIAVILLDIIVVLLVPNFFEVVPLPALLVADLIVFLKTVIFTALGIYYAAQLGIVEIPLIKRLSGRTDNFQTLPWRNYIITVIGVVAGAVGFSVMLFKLTSPEASDMIKQLSEAQGSRLGISSQPTLLTGLVVIAFALGEEILFRLGLQNYLAHQFRLNGHKYWIAVVLTAGLWSLAHANILTPEWVKIVQIFPFGIVLGFVFKKYGLESCILAHGFFNLSMMFLGPSLIT